MKTQHTHTYSYIHTYHASHQEENEAAHDEVSHDAAPGPPAAAARGREQRHADPHRKEEPGRAEVGNEAGDEDVDATFVGGEVARPALEPGVGGDVVVVVVVPEDVCVRVRGRGSNGGV